MPDSQAKIYADGSSFKEQTISGQSGEYKILKASFKVDKFVKFLQDNANEKGYVNVDIRERQSAGTYGETHYGVLNTYKAGGNTQSAPQQQVAPKTQQRRPAPPAPAASEDNDDIPF